MIDRFRQYRRDGTFGFYAGLLLAVCLVLLRSSRADAQAGPFSIQAVHTDVAPRIDGTLADPVWQRASRVKLGWDFTFRRAAEEPTEVYLLADARFLYVAFDATQVEPVTATQYNNDVPLSTDDIVNVYLWPDGTTGFNYTFSVNPIGSHYASSSENTTFAPKWESAGRRTERGYVVTERIPLNVLRGKGANTWLVQFDRTIRSTNVVYEWTHDPAQLGTSSVTYAGAITNMGFLAKTMRVKPRLQLYALDQTANGTGGTGTSRAGADFAVPITPTASFIGTLHPDYSNVELDQQTISPSVFPIQLQEVRPFFTQGSRFYNTFTCHGCVDTPLLYTPAIPTPREGFAIEGVQGRFRFGALDAVSTARSDAAQSVGWSSPDQRYYGTIQRQTVDFPGVHDLTTYYQAGFSNIHNFEAYVTQGNEQGTDITTLGGGLYREYGGSLFTPNASLRVAYHDVGPQYAPLDGYNYLNDVKGPTIGLFREFDAKPTSFVQTITISQNIQHFHSHAGDLAYTLDQSVLTLNTRTNLSLSLSTGESYLQQPGQPGGNADQSGIALSYKANTSTPSSISYRMGRFGQGFLRSWQRLITLGIGHRGTLSLEGDDTMDVLDDGSKLTRWLERASFAYQLSRGSSLALGFRRIKGMAPTFFSPPNFSDATNVSLAYYKRFANSEIYLVYGDPNVQTTQHDLILKFIQYIGAQKGT